MRVIGVIRIKVKEGKNMTLEEIKQKLNEMVPRFAAQVAPVYQLLKWEWSPGKSQPHIPSVGEIENALYDLIEGLSDKYHAHGTGGLEAYYEFPDENEPGSYGLTFEIKEEAHFDQKVSV